jgi:hypothetical protein
MSGGTPSPSASPEVLESQPLQEDSKVDVGLWAGVGVGVIVLIGLIVVGIFIWKRWRRSADMLKSEASDHAEWAAPSV